MRTYGVVLAGGVGERAGVERPKQMEKVAGKSILEHTVGVMAASQSIDEVIVMITPSLFDEVTDLLANHPKVTRVLPGGKARTDTTRRVVDAIDDDEAKVVLHDAVRPLLDERIISDCVTALDRFKAVDVVIPSSDTIVQVGADNTIESIPDRARLRRGQTPQAFHLSVLRRAYDAAAQDPDFKATDDCGVVIAYCPDVPVVCVHGSEDNIKITHPIDFAIADKLFQVRTEKTEGRSPSQPAAALKGKVIVVIGGSYGIGEHIVRGARDAGAKVLAHSRSTTGLRVEDSSAVDRALTAAYREHGRIDAVVVTAGLLKMGRLDEMSEEQVNELIAVNYAGPVNVARSAHRYLAESHGHLLLFTSSSYTRGREGYALYSSSKAAVVNLTQALSAEWSAEGIKVNVLNPERAQTPMRLAAFGPEDPKSLLQPERAAQAALNVLASNMTGSVVDVRRPHSSTSQTKAS
ncbi:MAG: bifunctional cytidylyltransferase/SDR family oxidoreductase [Bifidobacteriaceae bacterium]|jgi:2-C-methyl-D-erythritol 4-phosphate cytidylyltransferase|nr:bifunctional cytidylyltransferase/SDR family oxidoreductase [Bifidobacteriaceae bacterium]